MEVELSNEREIAWFDCNPRDRLGRFLSLNRDSCSEIDQMCRLIVYMQVTTR